jgi:hypothetical protein
VNKRRSPHMRDWTFSGTADLAIGLMLALVIAAMLFV